MIIGPLRAGRPPEGGDNSKKREALADAADLGAF
jgi:hypothetical protein